MAEEGQINILDGLQRLLDEQVELARRGNSDSARFEQINRQADVLARKIAQVKMLRQERFGERKGKLRKTYDDLCLAIMAEQKQTAEDLDKIRKGKKTVGVYQKNL
jgi:hypothetical protein